MNCKTIASAAALSAAALAAPLVARAVSVSDGFPAASGAPHGYTASLSAFDSFVASRASAASAVASFSSFVSTGVDSAPLPAFRSDEPAGFVLILR